ncbi:hypothetical protein FRC09_006584 [Ceratobasidium sp. 395]|nr:hypothetical protein FRC09_006584 [Ceratobasidium sp. 395]
MPHPSPNKFEATHRVLGSPELFKLICERLGKNCAKLTRVSRRMFAGAAPMAWAAIEVRHLLNLIPGLINRGLAPGVSARTDVYSLEIPAQTDLKRFGLYAPFVKRLNTSSIYAIKFSSQWEQSRRETAATPLLPNLLHIRITDSNPIKRENIEWATLFIGPSLLSFELFCTQYRISSQTKEEEITSELVARMSGVCTHLEKLRICSRKDIIMPISGLNYLRSFSINERGINGDLIDALGLLPRLEELSAFREYFGPFGEKRHPIQLLDDSFPSLRYLALEDISPFIIAQFCNSPKLFRKLEKISIRFGDNCNEVMGNLERLTTVVLPLGRNSPRVTNLTISLQGWFAPSWSIIESFKRMPLRYLDLSEVVFGPEDYVAHEGEGAPPVYHPAIGWHDFLAAVPLLEEFGLSKLDSSTLPIFASMLPHLRRLELREIEFSGAEEVSSAVAGWHPATQSITVQATAYKIEVAGDSGISNVTRYVHHLWPNVVFETWGRNREIAADLNRAVGLLKAEEFQAETNA